MREKTDAARMGVADCRRQFICIQQMSFVSKAKRQLQLRQSEIEFL